MSHHLAGLFNIYDVPIIALVQSRGVLMVRDWLLLVQVLHLVVGSVMSQQDNPYAYVGPPPKPDLATHLVVPPASNKGGAEGLHVLEPQKITAALVSPHGRFFF